MSALLEAVSAAREETQAMKLQMWRIDFEAEEGGSYYSFLLAENPEKAREEAQSYLFDGDRITEVSGPIESERARWKAMNA